MMMGYYITRLSYSEVNAASNGVGKKIISQMKSLEKAGLKIEMVNLPSVGMTEKILSKIHPYFYRKFLPANFFLGDFYYFRYLGTNIPFINLLKKIKKNKNSRILVEIPTYPYDEAVKKYRGVVFFTFLLDRLLRKKMKKYVDRIITTSLEKYIFGIPAIYFTNGIDISSIPVNYSSHEHNEINLIAVAIFSYHHAYERMIIGLNEYYKQRGQTSLVKVFLHLVGVGKDLELYRSLAQSLKLEEYIVFYGLLSGDDLTNVFNKCDIGISGLGFHRIQLHNADDLKSREYLARGLPMIISAKLEWLPEEYEYCYFVPGNETPVDIEEVVNFYHKILKRKNIIEITAEIREFAEKNCDISSTMKPIIDYLFSPIK
jgi:hypothetical protein